MARSAAPGQRGGLSGGRAMDKEKATPEKEAALKALREEFRGNSRDTQMRRLAEAFHRLTTVTTIEARRFLDILHPAGRVNELRQDGLDIITLRERQETEAGIAHLVGRYVLRRRGPAGGAT